MKPVEFDYQNVIFAKDQPQYNPLPALVIEGPEGAVVSCWEVTDEEIEELKKTKRLYVASLTFGQHLQPLSLTTDISDFIQLKNG